jgi:DNA-binding MarR family transcriptional regulator
MTTHNNADTSRLSRLAAEECLNFNLRKADRALSQAYDKAVAAGGIKSTQFTLLNGISLSGGASISSLAAAMVMDRTTLTRNLAPLARDGLVDVVAGTDRRTRSVAITPKGRALLGRLLPLWHAEHERLRHALGAAATAGLLAQLRAVVGVAGK